MKVIKCWKESSLCFSSNGTTVAKMHTKNKPDAGSTPPKVKFDQNGYCLLFLEYLNPSKKLTAKISKKITKFIFVDV